MRITKRQLRRIIREQMSRQREFGDPWSPGDKFTRDEIIQYLSDNASAYHEDPSLNPAGIKMLLQDDFMDDIGHQASIDSYEELIDQLSIDPSAALRR